MKKTIGIIATHTSEGKLTLNANYIDYFKLFGHPILIDPFFEDVEIGQYDLIVLPGGADVNPERYGAMYDPTIGLPDRSLECFDKRLLPYLIEGGQPIFGICRGLQTLNVTLGGTLKTDTDEPMSYSDGDPAHFVKYEDSLLFCSSNHHQAIDALAEGLVSEMEGWSFKLENAKRVPDKVLEIEAIKHISLPIAATQFHPEKNHSGGKCKALNEIVAEKFIKPLLA